MSTTRHDDNDGSDIFWPGYVDATTNLILNLLFLLTILIVAVFMFALELGRTTKIIPPTPPIVTSQPVPGGISDATTGTAYGTDPVKEVDPVQENIELKREIQRLKKVLAEQVEQKVHAGGLAQTIDATSSVPKPVHGIDKTLASDLEVVVRFKNEAVDFTSEEREQLLESLQAFDASENIKIQVVVPAGFSEAKRMGFYRAMAVRNLLLELKVPQESIDVTVVEGKNSANASLVRVRSY